MPRNGSGSYSLPEAPFVPQTPISSAAVNSDFSDIASALTGSLARDGQGGMTAELPLANVGFSYSSDPNTGMHRTGADAQAIECGGVDIIEVDATGVTVNGDLEVTGDIRSGGVAIIPIGLGPLPWSGLTAPPKWVLANGQSLLRASYPDLWAFAASEIALGNTLYTNGNGTTTFTVTDMNGRLAAGKDNGAGRLTSATMTPNGETLGAVNTVAGGQTVTLSLAQLPTGITSAGAADVTGTTIQSTARATSSLVQALQAGGSGFGFQTSITINTLDVTASGSADVTSDNTGGSAHSNVQPTIVTNYIIYAGA